MSIVNERLEPKTLTSATRPTRATPMEALAIARREADGAERAVCRTGDCGLRVRPVSNDDGLLLVEDTSGERNRYLHLTRQQAAWLVPQLIDIFGLKPAIAEIGAQGAEMLPTSVDDGLRATQEGQ